MSARTKEEFRSAEAWAPKRVFQRLHEHSDHFLRVLQREVAYAVLGDEARFVIGVPDERRELWVSKREGGRYSPLCFVCQQHGRGRVLEHREL
jgi:hypothetical protein